MQYFTFSMIILFFDDLKWPPVSFVLQLIVIYIGSSDMVFLTLLYPELETGVLATTSLFLTSLFVLLHHSHDLHLATLRIAL